MVRPILLDVDTGTDDALAILYAVRHPDLKLLGVSCVAGNSGVDQVVRNTLKVLEAADASADIPVARGAAQPLSSGLAPRGRSMARTDWAGWSCGIRPAARARSARWRCFVRRSATARTR